MKKILAMVLAMMLVLSMSAAFAEAQMDADPVEFKKKFVNTEASSDNAESSADTTFSFTYEIVSFPSDVNKLQVPAIEIDTVTFEEGASENSGTTSNVEITNAAKDNIDASMYPALGKYVYKITERVSDDAGVNYDVKEDKYVEDGIQFYFVVTIVRDTEAETETGDYHNYAVFHFATAEDGALSDSDLNNTENKTEGITNTYSAGDLHVTKTVSGNAADYDHYFPITVTITDNTGKTVDWANIDINNTDLAVEGTAYDGTAFTQPTAITCAGTYTFYLKHSDTLKITNIPFGITYDVNETTPVGYADPSISFNGDDKKINSSLAEVDVKNSKEVPVDTGISLDNAPYMILMGLVVLAGAALIVKRASANR